MCSPQKWWISQSVVCSVTVNSCSWRTVMVVLTFLVQTEWTGKWVVCAHVTLTLHHTVWRCYCQCSFKFHRVERKWCFLCYKQQIKLESFYHRKLKANKDIMWSFSNWVLLFLSWGLQQKYYKHSHTLKHKVSHQTFRLH